MSVKRINKLNLITISYKTLLICKTIKHKCADKKRNYKTVFNAKSNNTAPNAIFRIFHNNITTFCRFLLLENTKHRLSANIRIMVEWTSTNWNLIYVTQISDKHTRKMKFTHVSIFTLYSFIT